MNSTILALHISSNSLSPIFSYVSTHQSANIKFSQIHTSKLFSNFIYSNHQINAQIYKSKFTNSLSAAIRVNEVSIINATRYNKLTGSDSQGTFSILDCLFYMLKTLGEDGGAVDLSYGTGTITVKNTGFFRCSSDKSCGGARLKANTIVCLGNCFHNCSAGENAAMAAQGSPVPRVGATIDANHTSFYNCPFSKLYCKKAVAAFNYFAFTFTDSNSSYNYLAGSFAHPVVQSIKNNLFRYSTVASCHSEVLLQLATPGNSPEEAYSYFNLYNNTVSGYVVYLLVNTTLSNFVFVGNTYKDGMHMGLAPSVYCIFVNSFFDDLPNFTLPASISQNNNVKYINTTNSTSRNAFPTLDLEFIETYQCWCNDVNTNSSIVTFYLQWKRTLIVLAILIGVIFLGVFGKRLFEYGLRKRAENQQPTDTESIIQPNSSAFNGQYDFDMY